MFVLAKAGFLPRRFCAAGKRGVPIWALVIPGILSFLLSLTRQGDLMITMVIFGATLSYILMCAAHIRLRITKPKWLRPYRTAGGIWTSAGTLILSSVALCSTWFSYAKAAQWSALFLVSLFVLMAGYASVQKSRARSHAKELV